MQLHKVYKKALLLVQQNDVRAKYWFAALIRYYPGEARAWLALVDLADTPEERRYCFDMVLELDPAVMPSRKRFNISSGIARRPACLDLSDQQLQDLMMNPVHRSLTPTTRLEPTNEVSPSHVSHYYAAQHVLADQQTVSNTTQPAAPQPPAALPQAPATEYSVHPDITEAEAIARKLLADPSKLGRWLGYGARLADEL